MREVLHAFLKAFRSQLHPRMLLLALLPFFSALLLWGGLLYIYWDPLTQWMRDVLLVWSWFDWFDQSIATLGFVWLKQLLIPLLVVVIALPLTILTAVLVVSTLAMPIILKHLCVHEYADVAERGESTSFRSLVNALVGISVFALGWLVTLPLWLIPPLGLILPFFWITYLNVRVLRLDALVQHASKAELDCLLRQHSSQFWGLGALVTLLCSLPLMWIAAPVFSGLAFAHYQLAALRSLRAQVLEKDIS